MAPVARGGAHRMVLVLLASAATTAALVLLRERPSSAGAAGDGAAWSALSRCLLGEVPGDEPASQRLRKIELVALGTPEVDRDAWPGRCAPYAEAVGALSGDARATIRDATFFARKLAAALRRRETAVATIGAYADKMYEQAEREGLVLDARADSSVPAPPDGADPFVLDDLEHVAPLAPTPLPLDAIQVDRVAGPTLRLMIAGRLCEVGAAGTSARCRTLAVPDAAGLHLLGGAEEGAAPLVFGAPAGESGVFRSDTGERVGDGSSYGAFARSDGFTAWLAWDRGEKSLQLLRLRRGKKPSTWWFENRSALFENRIALLWDQLVWAGDGELNARRVLDGESPTAPTVTIGPLHHVYDQGEALTACKTATTLVLLARGADEDHLAFLAEDRWSNLAELPVRGGALSCHDAEAVVTRVTGALERGVFQGTVDVARCSSALDTPVCASTRVETRDLFRGSPDAAPREERDLHVVPLGDQLLVAWMSPRGGLRMRLARAEALASTPDRVIFDDLTVGGRPEPASVVLGVRVFAGATFAVIAVATRLGVQLLGVGSDGAAAPFAASGD